MRQVKLITSQMQRKKRATALQMWDHVEDRASRRDLANKQIYQIKKKILRAEQNSDLVQLYAALPETGNAAVYATGNVDFRHGMLAFGNIVAFLQDNGGKVNKKLNFCVKDAWDEVTGADGIELIRHLRTTLLRIGLEGDLLDRLDAALQRGLVRLQSPPRKAWQHERGPERNNWAGGSGLMLGESVEGLCGCGSPVRGSGAPLSSRAPT